MNMVIVFLMSVLVLAYPPLQVNVRLLLFSLRYVYATLSSYFDGRYWLNVPPPPLDVDINLFIALYERGHQNVVVSN